MSAILGPVIYGIMLYKKPLSFPRIFIAKVLVAVFVESSSWNLLAVYALWKRISCIASGKSAQAGVLGSSRSGIVLYHRKDIWGKHTFFSEVRAKR